MVFNEISQYSGFLFNFHKYIFVMKKWMIAACMLTSLIGYGQDFSSENFALKGVTTKKLKNVEKDKSIKLVGFKNEANSSDDQNGYPATVELKAICEVDNQFVVLKISDVVKNVQFAPQSTEDQVIYTMLNSDFFSSINKNGVQYGLRKEAEEDALEYLSRIYGAGLNLDDPYLENYIYSLVYRIMPKPYVPYRTGQVNIVIEKDKSLNAGVYPNGTLILTTGLLAALQSEDELVAVLAHEIGHFVLDHSIVNINKQVARKKKAEFWSAVATGVAAAAEIAVASSSNSSNYYIPGTATIGTAIVSSAIASSIVNRLGMEYNHEQEYEADEYAKAVLSLLGYNPNALAVALSRIKTLEVKEGNYSSYLSSYSHPALQIRISKAGKVESLDDVRYQKMISFVNSANSLIDFTNKRFFSSYNSTRKNIDNQVATIDDLVINAASQQMLFNSPEKNRETIELLDKALAIAPNNLNAMKYKILAVLRMKDLKNAMNLLDQYHVALKAEMQNINQYHGQDTWEGTFRYLSNELSWCANMGMKLPNLY